MLNVYNSAICFQNLTFLSPLQSFWTLFSTSGIVPFYHTKFFPDRNKLTGPIDNKVMSKMKVKHIIKLVDNKLQPKKLTLAAQFYFHKLHCIHSMDSTPLLGSQQWVQPLQIPVTSFFASYFPSVLTFSTLSYQFKMNYTLAFRLIRFLT